MPIVVLCLPGEVEASLADTSLHRDDVRRHPARSLDEAKNLVAETRPHLLLLWHEQAGAAAFVQALRRDPGTRRMSIAVVAGEDFDPAEVELLEAGANATLRLPVSAEWDDRLSRLMTVPARKDVRFPAHFEILARAGIGVEQVPVMMVNLSVNGMRIESSYALSIGDDIDFRFLLPGSDHAVAGSGRVVREAGRNHYGVEFYGLEGDGAEQVHAYIERLGGTS
ncbi:MAG: PilZ domain-containing protein [Vicinamibacteria bacterium]|nr:PilZ domain-containing protein [Vicinamibacteria bacterium]